MGEQLPLLLHSFTKHSLGVYSVPGSLVNTWKTLTKAGMLLPTLQNMFDREDIRET